MAGDILAKDEQATVKTVKTVKAVFKTRTGLVFFHHLIVNLDHPRKLQQRFELGPS